MVVECSVIYHTGLHDTSAPPNHAQNVLVLLESVIVGSGPLRDVCGCILHQAAILPKDKPMVSVWVVSGHDEIYWYM